MNMHTRSVPLGIAATLALFAMSAVTQARSVTGFGSFHADGSYPTDPYTCLQESNGSVVNDCNFSVNLVFDLPVDNQGTHNLTVTAYNPNPGSTSYPTTFGCQAFAYSQGSASSGGPTGFTVGGGTTAFFNSQLGTGYQIQPYVDTPNPGETIQLICWSVPKGEGISNIWWSP